MANGMSVRAIQKEKTRRALVEAAFNQLSSEKISLISVCVKLRVKLESHRLRFTATLKIWTN